MRLRFHTLDVFTTTRFAGNPLAVVHDADGLDTARMQTIAREFNLAETVFVMKPDNLAHSAKIRIFTPGTELPFAGHPTVGTAALLADLKMPGGDNDGERDALIVLEEKIGVVRVGVRLKGNAHAFAEFDTPKLPELGGAMPPNDMLAGALGLIPNEIGFENHKPVIASAGVPFAFVPVASLEAIARAGVQPLYWSKTFSGGVPQSVYVYCRETVLKSSQFHARMFAPGSMGIPEDPATGSAAAAFAAVIRKFDTPRDGHYAANIEQGFEMGRPSSIALTLEIERGTLHAVRIGGNAVRVSEGTMAV
jgi:trans-2,3-dihydro-3-hydroxyanthranilate isomerase